MLVIGLLGFVLNAPKNLLLRESLRHLFKYYEEMKSAIYLSDFDLLLLLTILRLEDEAYGVPLGREMSVLRGREVGMGSVYDALERLERKGAVRSAMGTPTPERGGRAKRYFRVTEQGLRAVRETRAKLERLWTSLPQLEEGSR